MLDNTSATIFNKAIDYDSDAVTYHKTIIPTVHWEDGCSVSPKKNHSKTRTAFICIDFSVSSKVGKSFVPPAEFAKLGTSERDQYWTLACDDLIIKGSVGDEIQPGGLQRWMAAHPEAASISAVDTFDMGSLKHWEVYAK